MPDTQTERKEIEGLLYRGKLLPNSEFDTPSPLPAPGKVTIRPKHENYTPSLDIDYTDIAAVNSEIVGIINRINETRIELRTARREAAKAKYAYEHEKRVILIGLTGGTAQLREAWAELRAEPLYTAYLVTNSVADDVQETTRTLRTHLDALKEISNNLRRMIDLR